MAAVLARLLEPFRTESSPGTHYTIVEWDAPDMVGFAIYGNASLLRSMREPDVALAHVLWEINQAAVASAGERLVLHAAAAERDGQAVVLGAPSGAGKTTLVSALVAAGWGYLTDDVAMVDEAGLVQTYPKPIGVDLRFRHLFPAMAEPADCDTRYLGEHGFLTAADLGGINGASSALAAFVVPVYSPGAQGRLEPMDLDEAVATAVEQSFRVAGGMPDAARSAAVERLLAGRPTYRLVVDDLRDAVRRISDVVASTN